MNLTHILRLTPLRAVAATLAYLLAWALAYAAGMQAISGFALFGCYALGLGWIVWGIERAAQRIEVRRGQQRSAAEALTGRWLQKPVRTWNPLDTEAWFYGKTNQRFRQSLAALALYSLLFAGVYLVLLLPEASASSGDVQPFGLPAGGGSDSRSQAVRIQKVIQKKFIINPYSSIVFNVPDVDRIDLKIRDITRNDYTAGQTTDDGEGTGGNGGGGEGSGDGVGIGDGSGSGFGKGLGDGTMRFVRLRHDDRSWDKNFGIGGDMNMLIQYGLRSKRQKIADKTEAIDCGQLAGLPRMEAPAVLFVAGAYGFQLSKAEKQILREYLIDRHGMILADNLGGQAFHSQFFTAMREITGVQEVAIPRDDRIHRIKYTVPTLPIVVAHGGTVPYGWKVDDRWVVYYHPGAISDAWRDDHAGIKREIWEECYRLGVNVMVYAGVEKYKWIRAQH